MDAVFELLDRLFQLLILLSPFLGVAVTHHLVDIAPNPAQFTDQSSKLCLLAWTNKAMTAHLGESKGAQETGRLHVMLTGKRPNLNIFKQREPYSELAGTLHAKGKKS